MSAKRAHARRRSHFRCLATVACAAALAVLPQVAAADEDGVSFWVPGLFGSLAAAPLQPGFALTTVYYHSTVSADPDVVRARQITVGGLPSSFPTNDQMNMGVRVNLGVAIPSYTFDTKVFGGQLNVSLITIYGRNAASLDLTVNVLTDPLALKGPRSTSISDAVDGFGDLIPLTSLRWNAGVNNYMLYASGDIPVGAYDQTRIANLGIGHGALDGGFGYTYFNQQTGNEFSAVAGFTYNFKNPDTQYQNGVDFHLDWGTSKFLTKQFQIGLVGYLYHEVGCDGGSGNHVGCFQSRVASVGAQLGYIVPMGAVQAYFNLKAYREFESQYRAEGWNLWLTLNLSPAQQTPSATMRPTSRMYTK